MKNKDLLDKKEEIKHATLLKKSHLKSLEKIKTDEKKQEREKAQLCKICFYNGGVIAGQAFTSRDCSFCGKTETYPTTYTDALCLECAKDNDCCKHCRSELEY